ncbi:MAG: UDP-N-acetylglucosamine 2-epimerase (non-hydrolyzing) [bacterium]|nr:UDP-N-acetylglucosamine 2-epimerase (non-hydrolyzing) [bacterium]
MRIIHVVGARPNFMKVAPVEAALAEKKGVTQMIVHTGQHYDEKMSDVFFRELGIPEPDINLEVGSGSHAVQTANIMIRFEEVVLDKKPDLVLVYGDVNSTVAAAFVCSKLGVRIGHVEAGLRSFDRTMPEELNRLVTDQLADILFTPSVDGDENLAQEGIAKEKIFLVGNVMIDTLVRLLPKAQEKWVDDNLEKFGQKKQYCLATLHRPSNVDEPGMLQQIVSALQDISGRIPVVFPIHPQTRQRMKEMYIDVQENNLKLVDPLSYLDFLSLQSHAALVITDSGGVQEETTYLGIPCLTLRENTERPITITQGTNVLVGQNKKLFEKEVDRVLAGRIKRGTIPSLWDGKAGHRIADIITELM